MYPHHDRKIIWGFFASFVLHILVGGGAFILSKQAKGELPVNIEAISAVLVQKGVKDKFDELPVKPSEPESSTKRTTKVPKETQRPTKERKDNWKPADKDWKTDNDREEEHLETYRPPVGHKTGVKTVQPSAIPHKGDSYLANVGEQIRRNLSVPSIISDSEERKLRMNVQVVVYLYKNGRVRAVTFYKKSGSTLFDSALHFAIRKAAPFGKVPSSTWKSIKREGIALDLEKR